LYFCERSKRAKLEASLPVRIATLAVFWRVENKIQVMKISVIALCISMNAATQMESLEKQSISIAQSALALGLNSAPELSKEEEKPPSLPTATAEPEKAPAEPKKIPTEPRKVSARHIGRGRRQETYVGLFAHGQKYERLWEGRGADNHFESRQVIEATSIGRRPALRSVAVDAARE